MAKNCESNRFGFIWDDAHIERIASDKKLGNFLAIITKREQMEIRITPGGRISVYTHDKAYKHGRA